MRWIEGWRWPWFNVGCASHKMNVSKVSAMVDKDGSCSKFSLQEAPFDLRNEAGYGRYKLVRTCTSTGRIMRVSPNCSTGTFTPPGYFMLFTKNASSTKRRLEFGKFLGNNTFFRKTLHFAMRKVIESTMQSQVLPLVLRHRFRLLLLKLMQKIRNCFFTFPRMEKSRTRSSAP